MKLWLAIILLFASVISADAYTVILTWDASSGASSYRVYNAGTSALIQTVTGTTATITGLTAPMSFYVTASNGSGESVPSNTVSITAPVANVQDTITANSTIITWSALSGAASYLIYDDTDTLVQTVAAPTTTATISGTPGVHAYWLTSDLISLPAFAPPVLLGKTLTLGAGDLAGLGVGRVYLTGGALSLSAGTFLANNETEINCTIGAASLSVGGGDMAVAGSGATTFDGAALLLDTDVIIASNGATISGVQLAMGVGDFISSGTADTTFDGASLAAGGKTFSAYTPGEGSIVVNGAGQSVIFKDSNGDTYSLW